jgi:heptosyltransferase-2
MKVAVRVPNWIGDSILAVPALVSLQAAYPDAEIWIVAKGWVKDLFKEYPFVRGILSLSGGASRKTLRASARELKAQGFDAGLLLTNSFASAYLFYLAGIPQRWGFKKDGRQLLLTKGIQRPSPYETIHQVEYYLRLIAGLGIPPSPQPRLTLPLSDNDVRAAEDLLASFSLDHTKPLVVLNPGGYFGSAKRWPPFRYAETAALFQKKWDAEILIVGSAQETPLAEAISQDLDKKPVILTGKTSLRQLAAVLSRAALCVTNDSGPMHMANALGVPTVAVFGPTLPQATRPFQAPSAFIHKEAPCWPCAYRDCPFDHRCMLSITAEDIYEQGRRLVP